MEQNKASGLSTTNCNLSLGGARQLEVYEHQKNGQQRTSNPAHGSLITPVATPSCWNTQVNMFPVNPSTNQVNGYGDQHGTFERHYESTGKFNTSAKLRSSSCCRCKPKNSTLYAYKLITT